MLLRPKSITILICCLWPLISGFPKKTELLSAECHGKNLSHSIGCVAQSLIPNDSSHWVEFKDEHEKTASNCFLTCRSVFPNTR